MLRYRAVPAQPGTPQTVQPISRVSQHTALPPPPPPDGPPHVMDGSMFHWLYHQLCGPDLEKSFKPQHFTQFSLPTTVPPTVPESKKKKKRNSRNLTQVRFTFSTVP